MGQLQGKRVLVTRSHHQAAELSEMLRNHSAVPFEVPVIEITEPSDRGDGLDAALARLDTYDWVVVTSVNGADRVAPHLHAHEGRVAAIGSGTAERLESAGVHVHLVPDEFVAESLVASFPTGPGRVLVPRAEVARPVLISGLEAKGWYVDEVAAYKTVIVPATEERRRMVAMADVVTFTSSSTVTNFVSLYGVSVPPIVACIGPITANTAREAGLEVHVEPSLHTMEGLVAALDAFPTKLPSS